MPWSSSPAWESSGMSIAYSDSGCAVVGDGTKRIQRWLTAHAVFVERAWIKSIVCLTTANRRWPIIRIDPCAYFSKVANPRKTPAGILKDIGIQTSRRHCHQDQHLYLVDRNTWIRRAALTQVIPGFKRVQCSSTKILQVIMMIVMRCANSTHAIDHVDSTLIRQILGWLSYGQYRCRCLGWRVLTPSPWQEFHRTLRVPNKTTTLFFSEQ